MGKRAQHVRKAIEATEAALASQTPVEPPPPVASPSPKGKAKAKSAPKAKAKAKAKADPGPPEFAVTWNNLQKLMDHFDMSEKEATEVLLKVVGPSKEGEQFWKKYTSKELPAEPEVSMPAPPAKRARTKSPPPPAMSTPAVSASASAPTPPGHTGPEIDVDLDAELNMLLDETDGVAWDPTQEAEAEAEEMEAVQESFSNECEGEEEEEQEEDPTIPPVETPKAPSASVLVQPGSDTTRRALIDTMETQAMDADVEACVQSHCPHRPKFRFQG